MGDDRYKVRLAIGLAAITGTYEGVVGLDQKKPHSMSWSWKGGQSRLREG